MPSGTSSRTRPTPGAADTPQGISRSTFPAAAAKPARATGPSPSKCSSLPTSSSSAKNAAASASNPASSKSGIRQKYSRHSGNDRARSPGLLRQCPESRLEAESAQRNRPRLSPARPVRHHALRRRGTAFEARRASHPHGEPRRALYPRRTHHRAALRRHRQASCGLPPLARIRRFAPGHRAQSRRHQIRRLARRSRTRRRRPGRPHHRHRHSRTSRTQPAIPHRPVPRQGPRERQRLIEKAGQWQWPFRLACRKHEIYSPGAVMSIAGWRTTLPLSFAVVLLWSIGVATVPCRAQTSQGKPQKVRNPLNDLLDEAQSALDKNDFAAALPPLQKFVAEKPDVAYAHFQLAFAYTGLHQDDQARAEYEKAATLDPKMAEAHLNLGILLIEKDPAAASASLRKAVELLPSQSRPRFLLGVALVSATATA